MSEDIWQRHGILVTSFFAGSAKGQCIQITAIDDTTVDALDAKSLFMKLDSWLRRFANPELKPLESTRLKITFVGSSVRFSTKNRAYAGLEAAEVKDLAKKLDDWLETMGQAAIDAMIEADKDERSA